MAENRLIGGNPVIGIRPITDGKERTLSESGNPLR